MTQTIDLGEVKIHYAEAPGPGAALVILHGITGSHVSSADDAGIGATGARPRPRPDLSGEP